MTDSLVSVTQWLDLVRHHLVSWKTGGSRSDSSTAVSWQWAVRLTVRPPIQHEDCHRPQNQQKKEDMPNPAKKSNMENPTKVLSPLNEDFAHIPEKDVTYNQTGEAGSAIFYVDYRILVQN